MVQSTIVAVLVFGCAVYAAWSLMPAGARRALATALLKLPLPEAFTGPLRRATKATSGCGCDGCDHAPGKASAAARSTVISTATPAATATSASAETATSNLPATPQKVTFYPRIRH